MQWGALGGSSKKAGTFVLDVSWTGEEQEAQGFGCGNNLGPQDGLGP